MNSLTSIPSFPLFLCMEELFHSLFNTYPSTCGFNSIFSLLMQFMFKFMPFTLNPRHSSSYSLLSNYSETYSWIFYGNKNLSLASPVSFCFTCLLPFSEKHWTSPSILLVCIPLLLTHFKVHFRSPCSLPAPQKLLIPRSQEPPLDTFWCVFFFEPFIAFILTSTLWAILACWDTIIFFSTSITTFSHFLLCWVL